MSIGIDIRSLQDPVARGVSSYGTSIIEAMIDRTGSENFRFFSVGHREARQFEAKPPQVEQSSTPEASPLPKVSPYIHLRLPSKVVNTGMRFFGSPTLDGQLGTNAIFMPNLNFWSVGSKARLTVTVHDLSFLVDPTWFSPRERLWHRLIDLKGLLRRANAIITLSEHTKRELIELMDIDEDKIHHIAPGVPQVAAAPPSFRVRDVVLSRTRNLGASQETLRSLVASAPRDDEKDFPYILFLGAIEARKNIAGALTAFELLARKNEDAHFVLAGPRRMDNGQWTMDNSDRIHFLGQVSPEQKNALLRNAKALFLPSFYEGFGFPAVEAMSVGVPVVASSVGALPETIGNAGLLLDPMDIAGFAGALEQVLSDNVLRGTLIARGYERVKDLSWDRCAEETLRVICA